MIIDDILHDNDNDNDDEIAAELHDKNNEDDNDACQEGGGERLGA